MAQFKFMKPTDQPTGTKRLLNLIQQHLKDDRYTCFRFIVAFAKVSPLIKLQNIISDWRKQGKQIEAIIGVDVKGTSFQALQFAITNFDACYIAGSDSRMSNTFHPKIYLFNGPRNYSSFLGSNNFTVGGLETNFESFSHFDLTLPADNEIANEFEILWEDALKCAFKLDYTALDDLVKKDKLTDEENRQGREVDKTNKTKVKWEPFGRFPKMKLVPPSPIPKEALTRKKTHRTVKGKKDKTFLPKAISYSKTLAIQVFPHHNGEILLSKIAINQNPEFFGYPFEGRTTPKKNKNDPYFQREPDPIVNIRVFDRSNNLVVEHTNFGLNTVYYSLKHEIRITVPQDVIKNAPAYSMLVMRLPEDKAEYDYDIDIYAPDSTEYSGYLEVCNQPLPSGGKETARRFGWL